MEGNASASKTLCKPVFELSPSIASRLSIFTEKRPLDLWSFVWASALVGIVRTYDSVFTTPCSEATLPPMEAGQDGPKKRMIETAVENVYRSPEVSACWRISHT